MAELTYGTTVVRCARPEPEYIEITALGQYPTFLEKWRGWTIQWWCDWEWITPRITPKITAEAPTESPH